ncbi:MAG TPA: glycosyltransferase [Pirellulales bacterium]|nr:glycosyltransferase [Pirellulales bacterium]
MTPALLRAKHVPQADRLADSLVILLSMTVVQRFVGFARNVLFCLWLSAEELGQWDMAFSFLTLAVPVAVLSLPGCLGRYVSFYRQRGQLRPFLRRILGVTSVLAIAACTAVVMNRGWFSSFIFGRADRTDQVLALTFALLTLVAYNLITELLISLRMQRLASGLELFNTLVFAALGVALLAGWQAGVLSVVLAYASACLLSALVAMWWIRPLWRSLPAGQDQAMGQPTIWPKVVPFAAALWLSQALGNLFGMADRYILLHHSGQTAADSLSMVGEYYSSRIVPTLLMNVCGLLATVSLPFLSHDWEVGPRAAVSERLNLLLKLTGIGLVAAATAVLFFSPLLFDWALRGKFHAAPAILSLALAYACWSGLVCLAKSYLWCAERAVLVSVAYAVGLMASIGLNLVLAPRFGIHGVAYGTCAAHVVLLLVVYGLSHAHGFALHPGTWLVSAMPLVLWFGPWWAMAALLLVGLAAAGTGLVFDRAEKQEIAATLARYRRKLLAAAICRERPPWRSADPASASTRAPRNATEGVPYRAEPLRLMFVNTSLFVGGAESLQIELVRGLDRSRFLPEICCLKADGPLAPQVPDDVPVFHHLLRHKYDVAVVVRLARLLRRRQIDVVVTVGAGDRMFWGRIAAWLAGVPVIAAWLHSTGWPDCIGRLNRLLTPLTDAFLAVAPPHGRYLIDVEKLPAHRVHVVASGVDTERFRPRPADEKLRGEVGLPPATPVAGIVARLSREKNHDLFLRVAALVREQVKDAQFLIVGDGPDRHRLAAHVEQLGLADSVHFLGNRADVPDLLALFDVFVLTSHIEANPISILEALASGKPVVATRVGSVPETVRDGEVGYLAEPGDAATLSARVVELFRDPRLARSLGQEARWQVVEHHSMRNMIDRFQDVLEQLHTSKLGRPVADDANNQRPLFVGTLLSTEG